MSKLETIRKSCVTLKWSHTEFPSLVVHCARLRLSALRDVPKKSNKFTMVRDLLTQKAVIDLRIRDITQILPALIPNVQAHFRVIFLV